MQFKRTRAIVLKATPLREADKIIEFYSEDYGKMQAVARGVRKISSKLAGHLQPFTYLDLTVVPGRGELGTVTGAKAVEQYEGLRRDLKRVAAATYVAELVSRLTGDGVVSRRYPQLLRSALRQLDSGHEVSGIVSYFEWWAVTIGGWEPNLVGCAQCDQKLQPEELRFSFALSGILCPQCRFADGDAIAISPDAVKLLRCYADRSYLEVEGLLVHDRVQKEAYTLTDALIRTVLERPPKSKAFLEHLETV